MALQPDYTAGTITLTNGSANFTTSGAALVTANILPGDKILLPAKAMVLTIGNISGQNAGTLTDACPAGAAGAGQTYRIWRQSDLSRHAEYMAQLIQILGAGNPEALAQLTLVGNKGIYATGLAALALYDLNAFGRALGNLTMAQGKFISATNADTPAVRDIAGTVAQSGGVPTGAIVQMGNNANGNFLRLAGGLQICWHNLNIAAGTATYRWFQVWTYPAAFSSQASVTGWVQPDWNNSSISVTQARHLASGAFRSDLASASSVDALLDDDADFSAVSHNMMMRCCAIGRWHA